MNKSNGGGHDPPIGNPSFSMVHEGNEVSTWNSFLRLRREYLDESGHFFDGPVDFDGIADGEGRRDAEDDVRTAGAALRRHHHRFRLGNLIRRARQIRGIRRK